MAENGFSFSKASQVGSPQSPPQGILNMAGKHHLVNVSRTSLTGLVLATVLSLSAASPISAKESPSPSGPYSLITNPVHDRADQTGLEAGSVSVRWYPESGTMLFDSVVVVNGWVADVVKDGGTSNGDRVVVVFDHPDLGDTVKFQIEPGKLDIR